MLAQQAEDLWTADYELRVAPGMPFPTRMTVVRLPDRSLILISPIPLDDALTAELAGVGPVSYLLAPSLLHHLHLAAAQRRYPDARLLGPAQLAKKEPALRFEPVDLTNLPVLRDVFSAELISGASKTSETVFLHRPSRTLIVTDLVFNIETPPAWTTSLLLRLTGTRGRLAQSRMWRLLLDDAYRAQASCQRILEWDFQRLVVAHGNVIPEGAKSRLAGALTYTGPRALREAFARQ
jgi:hypothetical protein